MKCFNVFVRNFIHFNRNFYIYSEHSVPYEWKSPSTYVPTCIIQILTLYYTSQICICIPFLFYGICTFLIGFVKDVEQCLIDFNAKIRNAQNEDGSIEFSHQQIADIEQQLKEIVEFHAEARQLSD